MNAERGESAKADRQSGRDPVEMLAAEFVKRLRSGERPSVAEYAERYPELADEIRDLFPTIAAVEQVKVPKEELHFGRASLGTPRPERLGDFRIEREIGRGGMGIVYEAEQESLGRRVAVKVLPKLAILEPKQVERFNREARTAAGLHHTNIVPVFGVGQQDGFHYYVMQCIEGVGLDRVLARLKRDGASSDSDDLAQIARGILHSGDRSTDTQPNGLESETPQESAPLDAASRPTEPLPVRATTPDVDRPRPPTDGAPPPSSAGIDAKGWSYYGAVARLGVQVADALEYAHTKGTLHRDIKPANLIIDTENVVWVADFGLAKALEQDDVTRTGDVVGTPAYMAPEQLQGRADRRSDVYSLGMTLYELVALRPAFLDANRSRLLQRIAGEEPPRPSQFRPGIPRDLETIVLKAVAHEPGRRYASAAELAGDLRCFLEDRPIQARRATAAERMWRWCRRNPVVAGLTVAAATLLVLVAVVASIGYAYASSALAGEQEQRKRAEDTAKLAVEVLDGIYERFAPGDAESTSDSADQDGDAEKPVLSEGAAAVLEDLLVFYDRLAEQQEGASPYLEEVALANWRVGDIRRHVDQSEQAIAAYRRALDLYEKLDQASTDRHYVAEIATIHNELGLAAHWAGQFGVSREAHQTALQLLEEATEAGIDTPEVQSELDRTRDFIERRGNRGRRPPPGIGRPPLGPPHQPFDAAPPGPPGLEQGPPGAPPRRRRGPPGPPRDRF